MRDETLRLFDGDNRIFLCAEFAVDTVANDPVMPYALNALHALDAVFEVACF